MTFFDKLAHASLSMRVLFDGLFFFIILFCSHGAHAEKSTAPQIPRAQIHRLFAPAIGTAKTLPSITVKQQMMVAILGMKMHLQINNIAARQRCANTPFCRRSAEAHLNVPAVKAVQRLPQIQASEPIAGAAKPFAGANVPIRQQASPQRCHLIKHLRRRICQIWP